MDIKQHPIWQQNAPTTKLKISAFKKPFHLARIFLAQQYVKTLPRALFVGITGTVGKTTAVTACELILLSKLKTITTSPNLDPILNIPITILKIKPFVKKVILEFGIEYPGEMDFYLSIVKPATTIVTSIAYQHSEFLGDLRNIAHEKGKLVAQLPSSGKAILNWDDINVRKMAELTKAEVIFYGQDSKSCHVWAGNIKIEDFKTIFELNYGVERVKVTYPLLGVHQIYPALAAAALGLIEGISLAAIKNSLELMQPQEHRLEVTEGFNNSIILDDSYNGSPISVEAALDTLQRIPARRRVVVLGETKELGQFSEEQHRNIGRVIYKSKVELVLLGTGDAKYIGDELIRLGFPPERIMSDLNNPQMAAKLLKILGKGDVCLVKGSRSLRLDEVVERITKKRN